MAVGKIIERHMARRQKEREDIRKRVVFRSLKETVIYDIMAIINTIITSYYRGQQGNKWN